ncbi:hypothetical protein EVAR_61445_1 [Eumeta japonica]|uniref:Uncharacterized protein n=1 Tax=Eumeta variegata TaxID=151549 RepID=A0A4C1Z310_EUMVA|nr:hypothetical protein EVAR_61445_1 [Eumeta japonica]
MQYWCRCSTGAVQQVECNMQLLSYTMFQYSRIRPSESDHLDGSNLDQLNRSGPDLKICPRSEIRSTAGADDFANYRRMKEAFFSQPSEMVRPYLTSAGGAACILSKITVALS